MHILFSLCTHNHPLPMQLNPAGSALVPARIVATTFLRYCCPYLCSMKAAQFIWPRWPALRALLLPRLRLIYNGLAALMASPDLSDEGGRRVLAVIVAEADRAANTTAASAHSCGGGPGRTAAPHPLVVELAQALVVQPQFLNMIEAGAAWARQHAHLDFSRICPRPVSICLEDITQHGMASLHNCFSLSSPCPIDPASPKLLQAAFSWFAAALEMIKAGGWQWQWPANILRLLIDGLGIPLVIMTRRTAAEAVRTPPPPLPWADGPRCLECALQAAEWTLSAASAEQQCDNGYVWNRCNGLVIALHGSSTGKVHGVGQVHIAGCPHNTLSSEL